MHKVCMEENAVESPTIDRHRERENVAKVTLTTWTWPGERTFAVI